MREVGEEEVRASKKSWFIPCHVVTPNGKNRVVFNCSFTYKDQNLNKLLLTGPKLGASLFGSLVCIREHSIAVIGDIKGMFHQMRLLLEDWPLLRFIWCNLQRDTQPKVYERQVPPFGTCSPCCAIYALQKHVHDNSHQGECLFFRRGYRSHQQITVTLIRGRFWAPSTIPGLISHLPKELRSENSEQWLNQTDMDPQEPALGLHWMCYSDTLQYKSRHSEGNPPTMRNIYHVLASQYEPLGFLVPFTTRAKVLVQQL